MIDRHDLRMILSDLQHNLEQDLSNHFRNVGCMLTWSEAEKLIDDGFDKVYNELESRQLVVVSNDELDCLEWDYEEACDKLMTVRALAKEGQDCFTREGDPIKQDDMDYVYDKFESIIYEVES